MFLTAAKEKEITVNKCKYETSSESEELDKKVTDLFLSFPKSPKF